MRISQLKRRLVGLLKEFKGERIGMVGLGLIVFLFTIAFLAPVLAPETDGKWNDVDRWRDVPRGAAPVWMDYLSTESRAPHLVEEDFYMAGQGQYDILTFEYDYDYEVPPRRIVTYVEGRAESESVEMILEFIRPDGESLQLSSDKIRARGDEESGYTFQTRITLLRTQAQRDRIFRFARSFEGDSDVSQSSMDSAETIFSKANETILSDPEPLHGSYRLEYKLLGDGVEVLDSKSIFMGRIYGAMGTDDDGHDIGLGWFWGARYGLLLGLAVGGLTVVIGLFFGMTSAYYGGWVDEFMQRINELVMGIPIFPIIVIISVVWGRSLYYVIFIMGLLYWRGVAKTIRARGLQIRQETYVEASQALGAGGGRIIRTHMIPQMVPYALAEGALMVPVAIIVAAGLNVLGLGDPSVVTWGRMLSEANSAGAVIRGMWWWVLLPGIGITLVGFGFISAGMSIERIVNPKMKQS
ncbi:MAG: ABC transporter permease [Candidatus Hadarchaeia archaeon]